MKKHVIVFMVVLSLLTIMFTGCSTDEQTFYNAVVKTTSINTMESKTDIALKFDVTGLSAEEQQSEETQNLVKLLNNLKLTVNEKATSNTEKTSSKALIDATIDMGGMGVNTQIWVEADTTGNKPVVKEIFKLPVMAAMYLPSQYKDKEYMVYDVNEFNKLAPAGSGMDLSKTINAAKDFQENLSKFFKEYALQYNPGLELVKSKGTKVINNETLPVYELKLDDASFKALLKYTINDLVKNKDCANIIKDYLISISGVMNNSDSADYKAELEKSFADFQNNLPQYTSKINNVIDKFNSVKIIGDKGIVMDYAINKDGYIVNESGSVDLVIDPKAISDVIGQLIPEADSSLTDDQQLGVYKIGFDYNTDIYNINKDLTIDFPVLTSQNSFSYVDLVQSFMQPTDTETTEPIENEPIINVIVNGNALNFDAQPRLENGRVLVPVKYIVEALGANVSWNPDIQIVTITKSPNTIDLKIGSTDAMLNGQRKVLTVPPVIIDGRTFVPIRFISENMGANVQWDATSMTATISSK